MDNYEQALIVVDYDGGDGSNGQYVVRVRQDDASHYETLRGDDLSQLVDTAAKRLQG
ncbi:MAG: hypothetical protein PHQ28_00525 [Mycobacterium sp.]|nr:hypothetical protein [Mycobacterium sp.]